MSSPIRTAISRSSSETDRLVISAGQRSLMRKRERSAGQQCSALLPIRRSQPLQLKPLCGVASFACERLVAQRVEEVECPDTNAGDTAADSGLHDGTSCCAPDRSDGTFSVLGSPFARLAVPANRRLVPRTNSAATAAMSPADLLTGFQWRELGPFRGGRVAAATGVPGRPDEFYFGAVNGGVWKSIDAGRVWEPVFDSQPVASIGAIAVAPSAPDVRVRRKR